MSLGTARQPTATDMQQRRCEEGNATRSGPRHVWSAVNRSRPGTDPLAREAFGGLTASMAPRIEAQGRAPKTLVKDRPMATALTKEPGSMDLQKPKGSDLDVFYDRLSHRGSADISHRVRIRLSGTTGTSMVTDPAHLNRRVTNTVWPTLNVTVGCSSMTWSWPGTKDAWPWAGIRSSLSLPIEPKDPCAFSVMSMTSGAAGEVAETSASALDPEFFTVR